MLSPPSIHPLRILLFNMDSTGKWRCGACMDDCYLRSSSLSSTRQEEDEDRYLLRNLSKRSFNGRKGAVTTPKNDEEEQHLPYTWNALEYSGTSTYPPYLDNQNIIINSIPKMVSAISICQVAHKFRYDEQGGCAALWVPWIPPPLLPVFLAIIYVDALPRRWTLYTLSLPLHLTPFFLPWTPAVAQ